MLKRLLRVSWPHSGQTFLPSVELTGPEPGTSWEKRGLCSGGWRRRASQRRVRDPAPRAPRAGSARAAPSPAPGPRRW